MSENKKNRKWWNNGVKQVHSKYPPSNEYVSGRLSFDNAGAKIGSEIQRGKFWMNNGIEECMVTEILDGYVKGRLPNKNFSHRPKKGTYWWNNGNVEKMAKTQPNKSFMRGRLKTVLR